jgi:hypothetical protein
MPAIQPTPTPLPPKKSMPPPIPQTRAGELSKPPMPRPEQRPRTPSELIPVPSMIVQPGSSRVEMPIALMQQQGVPIGGAAAPNGFIDLSANVPVDTWMANPDTDLLRGHRMKQVRNIFIVFGLIAVLGGLLFVASRFVGGRDEDSSTVTTPADAAVRTVHQDAPSIDAGLSKDDIIAISRFGYVTIDSNIKPATVYIDGNKIGPTPQKRVPLSPGPHNIKVVGPKTVKEVKVDVFGGKDENVTVQLPP